MPQTKQRVEVDALCNHTGYCFAIESVGFSHISGWRTTNGEKSALEQLDDAIVKGIKFLARCQGKTPGDYEIVDSRKPLIGKY